MRKKAIKTDGAPAAIGPYSQGVSAGGFVFVSGQIPLDPGSGELVAGPVAEQTRRVMENVRGVLEAAGAGMKDVVRTTVYLTDMAAFADMNRVYGEFFSEPYPARVTIEAKGLPRGACVEIDAVAVLGGKQGGS